MCYSQSWVCHLLRRASIFAALSVIASLVTAADPRPNIVFILADDLGWRDLSNEGSTFYESPHIDRIAREGMKFTRGYATCQVCSPSRASILTGKYPTKHGITTWIGDASGDGVAPDRTPRQPPARRATSTTCAPSEITLAEALRDAATRPSSPASGTWGARVPGRPTTASRSTRAAGTWAVRAAGTSRPGRTRTSSPARPASRCRFASGRETAAFIEANKDTAFLRLSFVLLGARSDPDHAGAVEEVSRQGGRRRTGRGAIHLRSTPLRATGAGLPDLRGHDRVDGRRGRHRPEEARRRWAWPTTRSSASPRTTAACPRATPSRPATCPCAAARAASGKAASASPSTSRRRASRKPARPAPCPSAASTGIPRCSNSRACPCRPSRTSTA